jgi:hypothetical protein
MEQIIPFFKNSQSQSLGNFSDNWQEVIARAWAVLMERLGIAFPQNPNLLRLGANVDLRLDAISRHFERKIERVDALLELKGPVNQRF